MPLTGVPGKDIQELMQAYKHKGRIGRARPETKAKALQMSIAIALQEARKKKKGSRRQP